MSEIPTRVQFDPRMPISMANSFGVYERILPLSICQVLQTPKDKFLKPFSGSGEATKAAEQVYEELDTLRHNRGQNRWRQYFMGQFSRQSGIGSKEPRFAQAFQTYLGTALATREETVAALMNLHPCNQLPSIRYINDKSLKELYNLAEKIPYQIAIKLLPDITDEEAHKLFGQKTSAEEVFKKGL